METNARVCLVREFLRGVEGREYFKFGVFLRGEEGSKLPSISTFCFSPNQSFFGGRQWDLFKILLHCQN